MLLLPFRLNSCVFVVGLSLSFQILFFVAALSASFNKSLLLIASPSFSLELVRFRCGSFPVVPRLFFFVGLFFFVAALSASSISLVLKITHFRHTAALKEFDQRNIALLCTNRTPDSQRPTSKRVTSTCHHHSPQASQEGVTAKSQMERQVKHFSWGT